jgi:hypothetical protein
MVRTKWKDMRRQWELNNEAIENVTRYIEDTGLYKGGDAYSRETISKAPRFYLAYYMKSVLGLKYREICEIFRLVNKDGVADHASPLHWIRQWGNIGDDADIQALTEDVRYMFPLKGETGYLSDLGDKIMDSIYSVSREMYVMKNDHLIDVNTISDMMRITTEGALSRLRKYGVTPKKVENNKYLYSKDEVMRYVTGSTTKHSSIYTNS